MGKGKGKWEEGKDCRLFDIGFRVKDCGEGVWVYGFRFLVYGLWFGV